VAFNLLALAGASNLVKIISLASLIELVVETIDQIEEDIFFN